MLSVFRLAKHYDFTGNELDFATNYGINYRKGRDQG